MDFLQENQADLMMILSGVCGVMALFVKLTDTIPKERKKALMPA